MIFCFICVAAMKVQEAKEEVVRKVFQCQTGFSYCQSRLVININGLKLDKNIKSIEMHINAMKLDICLL